MAPLLAFCCDPEQAEEAEEEGEEQEPALVLAQDASSSPLALAATWLSS